MLHNRRISDAPLFTVLILDPDPIQLEKTISGLENTTSLNARPFTVVGVSFLDQAIEKLKLDGSIQTLLIETTLPESSEHKDNILDCQIFLKEILNVRRELSVFLYSSVSIKTKFGLNLSFAGYFDKADSDFEEIADKLRSDVLQNKLKTPFFDALIEYSGKAKDSWHTPGHASGASLRGSRWARRFFQFFGQSAFSSDVSVSVPMLDSLIGPTTVIKEAQELAAKAFGARHTYFCTNGTSTSNKIVLQTLIRPGDAVILDRNCHKSLHYGVIISGAEPVYLSPSVNHNYGIFGPVPKSQIKKAIEESKKAEKNVKLLILTNCTYDGLIYDIPDIVKMAHSYGIKVMVDEAWFGHARFHHLLGPCAMDAGADYATQSTHKTMSAFSQASMIHINDSDFENFEEFFNENFCMHTSTSPQYPMIASLDVARMQMAMEGHSLLDRAITMANELKETLGALKKIRILTLDELIDPSLKNDNIKLEPMRLTIDISKTGLTSTEVENILLEKHNVQIEKSTHNTLTILITIGATKSRINRLALALEEIDQINKKTPKKPPSSFGLEFELSPIHYLPRDAYYCKGEFVSLEESLGRISISMIVPYPPGIPLLVPGQIITDSIIKALKIFLSEGNDVHGIVDNGLRVMTKDEENIVPRLNSDRNQFCKIA